MAVQPAAVSVEALAAEQGDAGDQPVDHLCHGRGRVSGILQDDAPHPRLACLYRQVVCAEAAPAGAVVDVHIYGTLHDPIDIDAADSKHDPSPPK